MLRHVNVCLQPDRPGNGCLQTAVRFARGYGTSLSALYVRQPAPPPYPPMMDPMVPSFPSAEMLAAYQGEVEAHERRQDEIEAEVARHFEDSCGAAGIAHALHARTGEPTEAILAGTKTADLVIVGRGQREDSPLGSVSGWLVRHLSRPVLLAGDEPRDLKRIAVAYDGSHGAERALSLAADIAWNWRPKGVSVHLLSARAVGEDPPTELALAEHYLSVYDVDVEVHRHVGRASDVIPEAAEWMNADLVVMGAYGHSLLREVLLGSTTQAVIARWRRPLLLWR